DAGGRWIEHHRLIDDALKLACKRVPREQRDLEAELAEPGEDAADVRLRTAEAPRAAGPDGENPVASAGGGLRSDRPPAIEREVDRLACDRSGRAHTVGGDPSGTRDRLRVRQPQYSLAALVDDKPFSRW